MASLLDGATSRQPLTGHSGMSGSRLEMVELDDGQRLVLKHMVPRGDWQMRATGDPDVRDAGLWTSGLLRALPQEVDTAILDVQRSPDGSGPGWTLIMRDVSDRLFPAGAIVSREVSRRLLRAAAAIHRAFRERPVEGLSSLADRYRLLSPAVAQAEKDAASPIPSRVLQGWRVFAEVVPSDVADAVFAVLERPAALADELMKHTWTLIHGDLQIANLGLDGERVILLDWGLLTTLAPPAVEYAYYLHMRTRHAVIDATAEQLIEDFRACSGELWDERAWKLALFGSLVMFGWSKALACNFLSGSERELAEEDFRWWIARAREALEEWAPR